MSKLPDPIVHCFVPPAKLRRQLQPLIAQRQWTKALKVIGKWSAPSNNEGKAWVVGWEISLLYRSSPDPQNTPRIQTLIPEVLALLREGATTVGKVNSIETHAANEDFVDNFQYVASLVLDVLVGLGSGPAIGEICDLVGQYILSKEESYRELLFAGIGYMMAGGLAFEQKAQPWPLRQILGRLENLARLSRAHPGLPFINRATDKLREAWCLLYEAALARQEPQKLTDQEEKRANIQLGLAATLVQEVTDEWECLRNAPIRKTDDRNFKSLVSALYWCRLRLWLMREAFLEIVPLCDAQKALDDICKAAARDMDLMALESESLNAWRVEIVTLAIETRQRPSAKEKLDFAVGALTPIMATKLRSYGVWPFVMAMGLFGRLTSQIDSEEERRERLNLFWSECLLQPKESFTLETRVSGLSRFIGSLGDNLLTAEHGSQLCDQLVKAAPMDSKRWCLTFSDCRGLVVALQLTKQTRALMALRQGLIGYLNNTVNHVAAEGGILKAETGEVCKFITLARLVIQIDSLSSDVQLRGDNTITDFIVRQLEALWEHMQVGPVDRLHKWLWSSSFYVVEPFLMLAVEATFLDASKRGVMDSATIDVNRLLRQYVMDILQARLAMDPTHLCPVLVLLLAATEVYLGNLREWRAWMNGLSIRNIQELSLRWLREASTARWMSPPYTIVNDEPNAVGYRESFYSCVFQTYGTCKFEDMSGMVFNYRLFTESQSMPRTGMLLQCAKAKPRDWDHLGAAAQTLRGGVALTFFDDLSPLICDASFAEKPSFLLPGECYRRAVREKERVREVTLYNAHGMATFLKRLCTEPSCLEPMDTAVVRERLNSPPSAECVSHTAQHMRSLFMMPWTSASVPKADQLKSLDEWSSLYATPKIYLPERTLLDPMIDPNRAERVKSGKWTIPMTNGEKFVPPDYPVWMVPNELERTTKEWIQQRRNWLSKRN